MADWGFLYNPQQPNRNPFWEGSHLDSYRLGIALINLFAIEHKLIYNGLKVRMTSVFDHELLDAVTLSTIQDIFVVLSLSLFGA
jgi:hypothetical protein